MHSATDSHGLSCDSYVLTINKKDKCSNWHPESCTVITVKGQILIYLINSSIREAVSPVQCALMTRTANASVAFGRICANV